MQIFKLLLLSALLVFSFSGCQGNNSDTPDSGISGVPEAPSTPANGQSSPATVILPSSATTLTTNSQVVQIDVRVFDSANNPYPTGLVKRINPNDVLTGRDIGTFDKESAELIDGVATFIYTGPSDLKKDTSNIVFEFYHDSNSSTKKTYTISIAPEKNQIILTNYSLKTSTPDGASMNLKSSETISYTIFDAKGDQLADENIKSMVVTSLNPSLATLSDSFGNKGDTLTLLNKNNMTVNLNSNTKSGIVPIKVMSNFTDVNGDDQNITEIFSMLILSGPPTAMSLSYTGTENVKEKAKFLEKWVLTVTDKYMNVVNTNPSVSMGMIAGYAQSAATPSNAPNYLYYQPGATTGATLSASKNTLTAQSGVFSNVDDQNDVLVTFGTGYKYDASGKWDIKYKSPTVLDLVDEYASEDRTEMGFAVGNNQREDACDIGTKWVANVYSDSNSSVIDITGSMIIDIEYDYYLTGKSTMLWVNLVGKQNSINQTIRLGEARKITLRGLGIDDDKYAYGPGYVGTVRFNLSISDTTEFYKNANFGYSIENSGEATVSTADTSMTHGVTSCINSGVAFIDVHIDNSSSIIGGEVSIKKVLPATEF